MTPTVRRILGTTKAMEFVNSHPKERIGSRKVPPSYVTHESITTAVIEPQFQEMFIVSSYDPIGEKLIACTIHTVVGWKEDNVKVSQIIQYMISGTSFE